MKKGWKIFFGIIVGIILFMVIISIIPPKKVVDENPFVVTDNSGPMLAAHRGGKVSNPENTMKAFDAAVNEFDVDILEMDLCLTSDNELVIIHNLYINSNCDVEEIEGTTERQYVNDYTYDQLLEYNFGYKFVDEEGNTPYKNLCDGLSGEERKAAIAAEHLNILKIEELFAHFYTDHSELLYIVEIKNDGDLGRLAADMLHELLTLTYPNLQKHVVIGTFHDDVEQYLKDEYPTLFRGASVGAATSFIVTEILNVNLFDSGTFVCLQIPTSQNVKVMELDLLRHDLISRAHKRNIAVQYWTINDRETMETIIDLNADAIMTDDPKLLHQVLVERGYRK